MGFWAIARISAALTAPANLPQLTGPISFFNDSDELKGFDGARQWLASAACLSGVFTLPSEYNIKLESQHINGGILLRPFASGCRAHFAICETDAKWL